jgi:hypothetical protein
MVDAGGRAQRDSAFMNTNDWARQAVAAMLKRLQALAARGVRL